jgi:hypothetical protein
MSNIVEDKLERMDEDSVGQQEDGEVTQQKYAGEGTLPQQFRQHGGQCMKVSRLKIIFFKHFIFQNIYERFIISKILYFNECP